jgi:CDP-glucose 4,6-dehydratase
VIGCALVERLLERGEDVVVLSRSDLVGSRFDTEGLRERCTLVEGDLTSLGPALAEHRPGAVFHLAARTQVGDAYRDPLGTWETNVRGTYLLMEAVRAHDTGTHVVVASSDKAYGSHDELPYREDFELKPSYPYDVSKAATDMIARSYAVTYDMPVAVTRLANVYGPGDVNWARLVPDTARALLRGERPVIRAWNAGSGEPHAALEVVERLIEISGRDLQPDIQGTGVPHGEIDRQFLDSTAIRTELGWSPKWDLDAGLRATWDWYERTLSG